MSVYRAADPSEDDVLSIILCNSFLPVWNHNWFQGITKPLSPVSVPSTAAAAVSTCDSCSTLQKTRIGFYRSLVKATRLLGGEVLVASSPPDAPDLEIQAILLWLPPHKRLSITSVGYLYRSGLAATMVQYGAKGIYRVNFVYEANIANMFKAAKVDEEGSAFIQMVASNTVYRERKEKYASKLLDWQMKRHWDKMKGVDVCLDTTTTHAVNTYLKLGYELIGEMEVDSGTDSDGFLLSKDASEEVRAKAKETCKQRIMIARAPSG